MSNKIKEATRFFKRGFTERLGDSIKVVLSPHSTGVSDLNKLPILVLQGPEIQRIESDYTIESKRISESPGGVNINELKKARVRIDLVFRIRLFADTLHEALTHTGRLIEIAQSFIEIKTGDDNYPVYISEKFNSDTIPNFSDIKHFESNAVIENIIIDTEEREEVHESSAGLNLEEESI